MGSLGLSYIFHSSWVLTWSNLKARYRMLWLFDMVKFLHLIFARIFQIEEVLCYSWIIDVSIQILWWSIIHMKLDIILLKATPVFFIGRRYGWYLSQVALRLPYILIKIIRFIHSWLEETALVFVNKRRRHVSIPWLKHLQLVLLDLHLILNLVAILQDLLKVFVIRLHDLIQRAWIWIHWLQDEVIGTSRSIRTLLLIVLFELVDR